MSIVMKNIRDRRSIRKYKQKEISKETILNILEAGRLAPSAKNRQPWHFVVLQGIKKDNTADLMEKYAELAEKEEYETQNCKSSVRATAKVIKQAFVLILIFKDIDDNWTIGDNLSIGACVENMLLYATDIGLGSLWIRDTYCISKEMSELYSKDKELSCAIALGYPEENPPMRSRKDLNKIVDWF